MELVPLPQEFTSQQIMNLSLRIRLHVLLTIQLIYYPDKF